jgi:hypothetical protein
MIPGVSGKGDCLFYYVLKAGQVYCAKVGSPGIIRQEYSTIQFFNGTRQYPFLAQAVELLENLPESYALIMP